MSDSNFNEITSQLLVKNITALASDRFLTLGNDEQNMFEFDSAKELLDKAVLRLRRNIDGIGGVRTILVLVLNNYNEFKDALRWAALIKDELLEPENGDLYMFVVIKDENLSIEQCTNIESSDRICRKYIFRPGETVPEFLSRTFIEPVVGNGSTDSIIDPLSLALEKVSQQHQWFDSSEQERWKTALLSGKSGHELIEVLFKIS
ncbi:hypothetical protein GCM10011375_39130 [Hymenobacter qilianensis]|uniref:Uncharacterized protein n=2 Tax=Hymenobacter qilianensis TaxID=1385715 RepID=A0A7H0H1H7_9BACT|nr:ABC-three component system middle component 1 [Hymenobacter qilianensis]QNP54393.1 hypothetical protein H9L05_22230 [Hymenobacter qilianensis]GGF80230.1 hypothetical protein GCM10011375_39130 [Hymenobacter qilianensis]